MFSNYRPMDEKKSGVKPVAIGLLLLLFGATGILSGCGDKFGEGKGEKITINPDPYPSTYSPLPSGITLLEGATILTATGEKIENGSLLIAEGKIQAVGPTMEAPEGAVRIDASGKWITPGLIDTHSHIGVFGLLGSGLQDGNESTSPVTADVWVEHSISPHDPAFSRALAGGITALQILPGSANLIGGRGVTLKNIPARTMQEMKFPDAPYGLKMACGENPKRVYGRKGRAPSTRMGNVAGYRGAWIKAAQYKRDWDKYEKKGGKPPKRDLELETLAGVLQGDILVHNHCYKAEEMAVMIDLAKEFGYKITSFHHSVEAYKLADRLAEEKICSSMWADWWGFKLEAYDGIKENIALVDHAGACAIVHSDSALEIQRLNQDAAKAMAAGKRIGFDLSPAEAIKWVTLNPAKALGIADKTGSLEPGKNADLVLWSGNPMSIYAKAELVYIDGALVFDMDDPSTQPLGDIELGQIDREAVR